MFRNFQLDMNHHLIGDEILKLAEEDVPPEDIVFHRFYMNKTVSSKKPKAKKKKASEEEEEEEEEEDDDDDAELLLDASDESDEEEIDNMLGTGHLPTGGEGEGNYDYDDFDRVVGEDDDVLLGNESDADTNEPPSSVKKSSGDGSDDADNNDDGSLDMILDSDDGEDIEGDFVDSDGSDGDESNQTQNNKKRKLEGKSRPSPFASLEEYEHLMTDDNESSRKKSKLPKRKKSKASKA